MKREIRGVRAADCEAILAIYATYVRDTTVSFEITVPTVSEFAARIARISRVYPYLVCAVDGEIVGYAYALRYREREAYRYSVEVSIYIAQAHHGCGIARALYDELFAQLAQLGYCNAYAVCTLPNEKSVRFHEKCGFEMIGIHHKTGYKFGQWLDVLWMERALCAHPKEPGEIRCMPQERE